MRFRGILFDIYIAAQGSPKTKTLDRALLAASMAWTGSYEKVYRVWIGRTIDVVCLGIDSVDKECEQVYPNMDALPQWMQERIAVLSMMEVDPPQTKVEGVGMRIAENVYWVIKG